MCVWGGAQLADYKSKCVFFIFLIREGSAVPNRCVRGDVNDTSRCGLSGEGARINCCSSTTQIGQN